MIVKLVLAVANEKNCRTLSFNAKSFASLQQDELRRWICFVFKNCFAKAFNNQIRREKLINFVTYKLDSEDAAELITSRRSEAQSRRLRRLVSARKHFLRRYVKAYGV